MNCERCGKEPAVVPVMINGHMQRICAKCYQEIFGSQLAFGSPEFLTLVGMLNGHNVEIPYSQTLQCPSCGMTYRQFVKDGIFGCAHCYEAFAEYLEPIFQKLHVSTEHCGKIPKDNSNIQRQDRLEILEAQKREAVEREDYERAGRLKRQIEALMREGEER